MAERDGLIDKPRSRFTLRFVHNHKHKADIVNDDDGDTRADDFPPPPVGFSQEIIRSTGDDKRL